MVDLATLEAVFLVAMGGWLIVLGGAFALSQRAVDRVSAVLLALAGVYAILWQQPALLGFAEAVHVAIAQPVFLFLLSGAIFLWTYWLFERHADRLETALGDLEEALSLERTLVDVLSHDLRNPIASAKLELQTVSKDDPRMADRLSAVEEDLEQAMEAMRNGLAFSRLSHPAQLPTTESLDLAEAVERAVDNRRSRMQGREIEIGVQRPANLPAQVSPLIQQAIENLLDNAIKFSPEGGRVRIELTGEDGQAHLTVTDEGPGIPAEERDRLFQRFETGSEGSDGAGLGLAIVQRIVELHDGSIDVATEADVGTRIELTIPCHGEADPLSSASEPSTITDPAGEVIG